MSATEEKTEELTRKRSRLPLIVGLVLMGALGASGFYASYAGYLFGKHEEATADPAVQPDALPPIAFVPIEPIVVSLGPEAGGKFLHFTAQLEVEKAHEADVTTILPRILDVLNGFLRAVESGELEDSAALVRLRAQMLRRVQIVSGEGRVRDLLVTEFVIN